MKTLLRSSLVAALLAAGTAQAAEVTVTSIGNSAVQNQWYRTNYRDTSTGVQANTVAAITATNQRSGNGSIEMSTGPTALGNGLGKADFAMYWGYDTSRTLGSLSSLGFDWFRGADTAAAHFAPALRLAFDADGVAGGNDRGYLIWELVYQGNGIAAAPRDGWISSNLLGGAEFYQRTNREIPGYDITLGEWAGGETPAGGLTLGANTAILGIEFGIGSGWSGTFNGFVDNVRFGFGGNSTTYNFEVGAAAVPEPASLALLGLGALGFAAGRRRKQK